MPHVPDIVTDPASRARLSRIQERLAGGLAAADPHHRLAGRPMTLKVVSGQTVEIAFKDVPSIDEGDVLGVKKLIGEDCFCTVSPQTAETVTVRFVVPLTKGR